MFVSVIVCTRNRCDKLHLVLDSLNELVIPDGVEFEAVIVDNGSSDTTAARCAEYAAGKQRAFRYIFEGTRGKSSALNTGMRAARGDVFGFTDDDCVVDRQWLVQVVKIFSEPEIAVAGGRVELFDKRDRPSTLITETEPMELNRKPRMFFKPLIIGANTAFRRKVYEAVGDYDLLMGPGSPDSAVAEDMDYIYRAYRKRMRTVFRPELIVYHNHGRQTDAEGLKSMIDYKTGRGSFYAKHFFADPMIAANVLKDFFALFKSCVSSAFAGRLPRYEGQVLRALYRGAMSRNAG